MVFDGSMHGVANLVISESGCVPSGKRVSRFLPGAATAAEVEDSATSSVNGNVANGLVATLDLEMILLPHCMYNDCLRWLASAITHDSCMTEMMCTTTGHGRVVRVK